MTEILRGGARRVLARAVELEAEVFLAEMKEKKRADGRERLVRHGPERAFHTGIGPVAVSRVKIRDRGGLRGGSQSLHCGASAALGGAAGRDALLPAPLTGPRGVSTGDFQEALSVQPKMKKDLAAIWRSPGGGKSQGRLRRERWRQRPHGGRGPGKGPPAPARLL